jgi:uncharacterized protein YxjI
MLNRTTWFIREHVGLLKLSDTYDILDPEAKTRIGQAREEISGWTKFFRLLINKSLMPTTVRVYESDEGDVVEEKPSRLVFAIRRGVALFRPKIHVTDASGVLLGWFQSKFSLGGAFRVFTADGTEIALVKGDWKGWNFRFLSGEVELGVISKKWAGLGKELFTSADNYIISINGNPEPSISLLLLAAGLAVDTVLKEKG